MVRITDAAVASLFCSDEWMFIGIAVDLECGRERTSEERTENSKRTDSSRS